MPPPRSLHAFIGIPGVWVLRFGRWRRPLRVWMYLGAWRVLCHACGDILRGPGDFEGYRGFESQQEAFAAVEEHCRVREAETVIFVGIRVPPELLRASGQG